MAQAALKPANVVPLDPCRRQEHPPARPDLGVMEPYPVPRGGRRLMMFLVLSAAAHAGVALVPWSGPASPQVAIAPPEPLTVSVVAMPAAADAMPAPSQAPAVQRPPQPAQPVKRPEPAPAAPTVAVPDPRPQATEPKDLPPAAAESKPEPHRSAPSSAAPAISSPSGTTSFRSLPAAPAAARAPIRPPSFSAAYLNNPPPAYPLSARRMGQEGVVVLKVRVDERGRPDEVQLSHSSGFSTLDDAALKAVKRWSFVPARQADTAVAAWVEVPVRFRLEQ